MKRVFNIVSMLQCSTLMAHGGDGGLLLDYNPLMVEE